MDALTPAPLSPGKTSLSGVRSSRGSSSSGSSMSRRGTCAQRWPAVPPLVRATETRSCASAELTLPQVSSESSLMRSAVASRILMKSRYLGSTLAAIVRNSLPVGGRGSSLVCRGSFTLRWRPGLPLGISMKSSSWRSVPVKLRTELGFSSRACAAIHSYTSVGVTVSGSRSPNVGPIFQCLR